MSVHVISAVLNCRNSELSCARRMVLVVLADHASGEDARCWPSQQLVADEAGCGIRTVKSHIKWLEDNGYIIRTTKKLGQGNGSRTSYKICLSRLQSDTIDRGAENAGANIARANSCTLRGEKPPVTNRQEPSIDTSNEVSKPKSKKRGSQIGSWTPGPMDLDFARKKGLTQQEINHALEAFPAHHQSKGTISKDWSASWRTWCLNTVKFRKPTQHAAGAQGGADAFDRLRQKLEIDTAGEQGGLWNEPGAVEGEFINITPNAHARSASGGY